MAVKWIALKLPHRRVQIPAYTDLWMRGARFGKVVATRIVDGRQQIRVKMDHPQVKTLQAFIEADCTDA